MSVSQILNGKSREMITAESGHTVRDIAKLLAEKRIGAVVITTSHMTIQGIVSERDVVRCIAHDGPAALDFAVSKIMTKNVKTCAEEDSEMELMALMTENRIRHLPVVKAGKLIGMVSIGDVVKYRIGAIEREAAEMKAYIANSG